MIDRNLIATKAIEAGTRLTVRSALNPILWLCAIITVPSFVAFTYINNPPVWWIALAFAPVCAAVFGFLFLLFFDRDKLQSEEYQLRKQSLEMIQESGDKVPKIVSVEDLDAIAEPGKKELESGDEEEDHK